MIQEFVREMNAEERAWIQRGIDPSPVRRRVSSEYASETWGFVIVWIITLVAIALIGKASKAGLAIAAVVGLGLFGYRLAGIRARNARNQQFGDAHQARNAEELAGALADGRVTVKRVSAVAVIEIEPMEDEGTGYVFDLGDGGVLFLKGQDYVPTDDDHPWPNTGFELVRTVVHDRLMTLTCHGTALRPLRVVPGDDVDPQKGWGEREEVLRMSMDDAVRTVLLER